MWLKHVSRAVKWASPIRFGPNLVQTFWAWGRVGLARKKIELARAKPNFVNSQPNLKIGFFYFGPGFESDRAWSNYYFF